MPRNISSLTGQESAVQHKLDRFSRTLKKDTALKGHLHQTEAERAANAIGLVHVTDLLPGYRRERSGKRWIYRDGKRKRVTDHATLKRIASLALPPAWKNVWISPLTNSHLQATGIDARGRKQYHYHPLWREAMDMAKYSRMIDFAQALPIIRRRIAKDLKKRGLPREKVLAAVIRLLEETLIRIGNEEYVKQNKSYGLSTLRNGQVKVHGANIRFRFKGKSGKVHDIEVHDPEVATIVRQCVHLPEHEVFEYIDAKGKRHDITSNDVNDYLRDIAKKDFTAKDFRTWSATVEAALLLEGCPPSKNQTEAKRNVVQAIKQVAEKLGNTPAVCKKSYIHPIVVERYLEPEKYAHIRSSSGHSARGQKNGIRGLSVGEAAVLGFLRECL